MYGRARHLERRFDWFYLGGLVETRLAHHDAAAQLLTDAVRLAPDSVPARLALADALFDSGDSDGAAREYAQLTNGASAPHAHYGLGRYLEARGEHEAALTQLQTAVHAVSRVRRGLVRAGDGAAQARTHGGGHGSRCGGHSSTAPRGRRWRIR